MNRFKLEELPSGSIQVEDTFSGLKCLYSFSGTWLHGDLSSTLVDGLVRRHLAAKRVSTNRDRLDEAQRMMTEDIKRAARAFKVDLTDRQLLFVEALAINVIQQNRSGLYPEEIVCMAASELAAKA